MKPLYLFIDQYGTTFQARTVQELRSQIGMGGSRVRRMYVDKKDGTALAIGYVIGAHWRTQYVRVGVK